ncbi:AraC family transcriptional regulator [Falsiroseomonas oryziterrae]|uniref:AraC family transcriptional regulator n=1 Tax=Falsiroseomonas oryziterrae TaxID=2911368 RepID=UPI001F20884E|nr:AraC family transcriptional regulator [Roseomonas sp. NPKOSM-4]
MLEDRRDRGEAGRPTTSAPSRQAAEPILFCTENVAPAERIDAWNDAFGRLNEIRVSPEQDNEVSSRSENWRLGGMVLAVNRVTPSVFLRTPEHVRRDGLDHWVVRVLRHGTNRLSVGGFCGTVEAGRPVLFSMHETWASRWTRAEWVSLTLPRDLDPPLSEGLSRMRQGPIEGPAGALLGDLLLNLPARLKEAQPDQVAPLAETMRAVLAGCLLGGAVPLAPVQGSVSQKERVRRAIRENIGSARLTPDRLAALAGMSRSSLYRLFEEEGGVARYVQSVRLAYARVALSDPAQAGRSIAQIAEAHGFPDASVFTRAFRQAHGLTPRDARGAVIVSPQPSGAARPAVARPLPLVERLYRRAASAA